MKKQILSSLGVVALLLIGCGGGSSGTVVNIAEVIEDKNFYRVITSEDRYLVEKFSVNILSEDRYFMDDTFDINSSSSYEIRTGKVYITEANATIGCSVEDKNTSVVFWCLQEGYSGSGIPTTRWKTLLNAKSNPEN